MDIAVLLRAVPDPVEELELNDDGTDLDREFLGYVLNEFDDHALEEALLLKDEAGASVTVYALGTADEIDQMLYTALAKGADAALKIGDEMDGPGAEAQAAMFAAALQANPPDLVLCGVQSGDELEGQVAVRVAAALGWPHVSVVVGALPDDAGLRVTKEYWGGITADYDVALPAVLGIQAAREAPRYVAVSRIRQAQESGDLTEVEAAPVGDGRVRVTAVEIPETGESAEMISGDEEDAADRIVEILREAGVA
jgi:electron transfer flavoprotein beta subunit